MSEVMKVYLEQIRLKNYKGIEEISIDLKPGINLLIGDNGAGKTSVLEGIAVALSGMFVSVPGVSTKNIVKDDVRVIINPRGDSSTSIEYCGPIESGCTLKNGEDKYSWSRIREDLSSSHTKIDNREVCNWMKEKANEFRRYNSAFNQFSKCCESMES